ARERVVVALTGGPEGETLLRRGARIAARSAGGELLAVHVSAQTGLRDASPGSLAAQAVLAEQLGGTFHQVVGDDIPGTLVNFARGQNASQLVIGISRRSWFKAALTGPGIGTGVIRQAGAIDVHIVNHGAAGTRLALPRLTGALTVRRRLLALLLALIGGPLLTWLLVLARSEQSLASDVLAYQLLVVVIALIGGLWPALFTALMSGMTLNYVFVAPVHTITVAEPVHILALALYVANGALVSLVVDQAARRSRVARRAAAESELLISVAGGVLRGQDALGALLARTREAFGLTAVRLVVGQSVRVEKGEVPAQGAPLVGVPVTAEATLELFGPALDSSAARLLPVIVTQAGAALEHESLTAAAQEIAPLIETDQVRSALLSAVSHDLRRPLTAAATAVGSLRQGDVDWSPADREELLATADESLTTLATLVTDLLDVSRVQAGVLGVACRSTDVEDVILPALDELHLGPEEVELDLDPTLPPAQADPALLRRVVVNVLANAVHFSPRGTRPRLSTSAFGDRVEIRVVDHGPGVQTERQADLFLPFHRLGDTDNSTGLGLGLALSRGFTEGMGGALLPEDTPGGGLTMVISLPSATATTTTTGTGPAARPGGAGGTTA
ncbi:MAG TPA: DUF4118 domain-containing protein, partial [Friedmanniella sp.]